MSQATVIVDDGAPVRTVTVNRPDVLNAVNENVVRELHEAFLRLHAAPEVRCVILTGAGAKAFAAGADIAHMVEMGPVEARRFAHATTRMAEQMESLPVPIIAAVNGFALGGGLELALCADFIYAASTARFGLPEVTLGVIPGFGGARRLADRVGLARARELVMTGRIVDAETALRIGLVNHVSAPEALLDDVRAVGDTIARNGPLAVGEGKRALRFGASLPFDRALAFEQELFANLFATADQKEGMRAFIGKRKPAFGGR